ncbi:MAG: DNA polymerase III subunit gamma/tau [Pseudomonadota bacterium]
MSYKVLARKWRPRTFGEMVGQEHVVQALSNALDSDRLHHAYLFTGTRGVGKTTVARIFAKSLNCETGVTSTPCGHCSACTEIDEGRFVDLLEVDAASRTKVDQTRELLENVPYAPARGRYKVYLIDEVHMFSGSSFNALLKTLEEPPPHVKFLLATTDPQKVPVTVLSRCLQFSLKRLGAEQIAGQLTHILSSETVAFESAAVDRIARAADGSLRDALSLLDQAIAFGGGRVADQDVHDMLGSVSRDAVLRLLEALSHRDGTALLAVVAEVSETAPDFMDLMAELLRVLHRIAVIQAVPAAPQEDSDSAERTQQLAAALTPEDVQLFYQIGVLGQRDLSYAPDPRNGVEMTLLRMLAFRPVSAVSGGTVSAVPPKKAATGARRPAAATPDPVPTTASDHGETAAVSTPPSATGNDGSVFDDWAGLLGQLHLGGVASQLAANSLVDKWDGELLTLCLGPENQTLKTDMALERLAKVLSGHLRAPVRVEIRIAAPGRETPSQRQVRHEQEHQEATERALQQDPFVKSATEHLGARVVPGSVEPRG